MELQSGTFDIKAAAGVTETLTLDASALAAQQIASSTPAHSTAYLGLKAGVALNSTSRGPAAAALPAPVQATRSSNVASCLRAPAAGGSGVQEHHAARAVTFAADVHDAVAELGGHNHVPRAGKVRSLPTGACLTQSMEHMHKSNKAQGG